MKRLAADIGKVCLLCRFHNVLLFPLSLIQVFPGRSCSSSSSNPPVRCRHAILLHHHGTHNLLSCCFFAGYQFACRQCRSFPVFRRRHDAAAVPLFFFAACCCCLISIVFCSGAHRFTVCRRRLISLLHFRLIFRRFRLPVPIHTCFRLICHARRRRPFTVCSPRWRYITLFVARRSHRPYYDVRPIVCHAHRDAIACRSRHPQEDVAHTTASPIRRCVDSSWCSSPVLPPPASPFMRAASAALMPPPDAPPPLYVPPPPPSVPPAFCC